MKRANVAAGTGGGVMSSISTFRPLRRALDVSVNLAARRMADVSLPIHGSHRNIEASG